MVWNGEAVMGWRFSYDDDVASDGVDVGVAPFTHEDVGKVLAAEIAGEFHITSRQHFVAHQMEAQAFGGLAIVEVGFDGCADVGAEFFPGVALGDDTFAEGFGDVAAVGFLGDFED